MKLVNDDWGWATFEQCSRNMKRCVFNDEVTQEEGLETLLKRNDRKIGIYPSGAC